MNDESNWDYKPNGDAKPQQTADEPAASDETTQPAVAQPATSAFSWTASEYIDHHQGLGWYAALIVCAAVLAAGFYFLTNDYFASIFVVVVAVIVGIYAARKPRQIAYQVSSDGFKIDDKFYKYSVFKSFAVITDGGLSSLNFFPVKRLMPPISAYFDAGDQDKIVLVIGDNLPQEEAKLDAVDKLSRRLRF